jgi:Kef-type K+ transport system membrane component KefB
VPARFTLTLRVGFLLLAAAAPARAAGSAEDPVAPVLLALVLIALGAVLGGRLMQRLGQPAVLGELLVGVIVANVGYAFHDPVLTLLRDSEALIKITRLAQTEQIALVEAVPRILPPGEHARRLQEVLTSPEAANALTVHTFVDLLSRLGVIVLIFLVGLETSLREMLSVGRTATLVAIVGVICPMALGIGTTLALIPGEKLSAATFVGGILTATSVGITARVFRDLGQTHRTEAKVILGAAVVDDVLGLIVLAVVSALVTTGSISLWTVSAITLKSSLFLLGSIGLGAWLMPRLVRRLARMEIENVKILLGLGLAFLLSWVANQIGLATIVGAFAAGLVLEELFLDQLRGHSLRELISPIETLVVPVFFVLMGMQVKLETFLEGSVVWMAAGLTTAAIAGKLVSGLACPRTMDRLSVGVGMMPRGEVGLIFASIGKGLGVVDDALFSAVVIMVMLTTLLTPPLLKITLARSDRLHAR